MTAPSGEALYATLSAGRYFCPLYRPDLRAELVPTWLASPSGDACGFLEDTLQAKNLVLTTGELLRSAHLSAFAYRSTTAGAALVGDALTVSQARGLPALFFSIPASEAMPLVDTLCRRTGIVPDTITVATASVYTAGLPAGQWNFNTADI